ncbi:MAG TPA: serine/threonine-protein kinase [Gemmatimonadaceae bacterium]|nr:serine/threonine-protein kinase [Gemmatimonadaceae bacterium]
MPVTDLPSGLVRALNERYELRGVLGRGGMATVYLANDRKHHRAVAIKVLRPEIAASLGAERFLQEIEIVARLTHPHVLPLHDSGEAESYLYYVMPLIDGGSLRQELEQSKRLTVDRVLAIAGPVANALSYAHRMGLLHRDIKPENILFLQGHAVVSDFGIARAVRTASDESFTRTGLALGTPGYMSPEQASGARDLTAASDVYSLAAVTYEMIVGNVPVGWPSDDEVHSGRFLDAPPVHRARLNDAGARIEAALLRGLALRSDRRTPTPDAFLDDLRGVAAPVVRRRYAREEVDAIVKRAAELEASNPSGEGAMTIGGIEQVAAEVGIKPELVRSAAATVRERPSSIGPVVNKPNFFAGGPTRVVFDRWVDGELPETEFSVLVDEVRRQFQQVGQVNQLGRSFSWTTAKAGGYRRELEVVVTVRAGRTRITVQEHFGNLLGGFFGAGTGILAGVGTPIIGAIFGRMLSLPKEAMLGVIPAWFVCAYLGLRATYGYFARRRARALEASADYFAEFARELIDDARSGRLLEGGQKSSPLR